MTDTPRSNQWPALASGILFILAFAAAIWALGGRLASVPHLSDQGPSWYFWKLPSPTFMGRLTAWGLYALHQLGSFALIAWAQKVRPAYSSRLHRLNWYALGFNGLFVGLHLLQTHVWYDGLAQDVSIWSALGSVAVLLIWVLLMENPRRGLFFGAKVPFSRPLIDFARRYHGYYFSWAVLYTFWYHPTEATGGHLVGFVYLLLIVLQGSLFFTRVHTNKWWTLTLEVLVLAHGVMVAVLQREGMHWMFGFGFASIFVVTQVHGLGLPRWARAAVGLAWLGTAVAVYWGTGPAKWNEPIRIAFIDYPGVFVLAGLLWLVMKLVPGAGRANSVDSSA